MLSLLAARGLRNPADSNQMVTRQSAVLEDSTSAAASSPFQWLALNLSIYLLLRAAGIPLRDRRLASLDGLSFTEFEDRLEAFCRPLDAAVCASRCTSSKHVRVYSCM